MTKYTVVHAGSMHALSERVNELLGAGYVPIGGVAVNEQGYFQAMAK